MSHLSTYAKKSLFACILLYFHMKSTLSYFVAFEVNFHYCVIKYYYGYFPVSQMFYRISLRNY